MNRESHSLPHAASCCTVWSLFEGAARLYPERPALADAGGRSVSFAALAADVERIARGLADRGIARGDRVAVLSENHPDYLALMLACARQGVILACQNWRLAVPELRHCIGLVEPTFVLHSARYRQEAIDASAAGTPVTGLDEWLAACRSRAPEGHAPPAVDPEDPLLILYTSGTTGLPKGAIISHRAEIARNLTMRAEMGLAPDDTFIAWTPLYHMGGADLSLGTLMNGGKVIVHDGFDAERLVAAAAAEPIGWLIVMPGTTERVIEALEGLGRPPAGVKVCGVMPDLIPAHQLARLTGLLGAPYANTFGSTETGCPPGSAGVLPAGELPEDLTKQQSPFCEVRLVDDEDRDVAPGEPGELAMRGPTLFSGYWRADETNARDFRGGWFHMGDVFVRRPSGRLAFVDRAKYLIKTGGENVYPAEIERVLLADADVLEAAVVRRPDAHWGEVPVAFVARRDDSLTADALFQRCRAALAGYKQPKAIRFIAFERFPRSASGKVLRHEMETWPDTTEADAG